MKVCVHSSGIRGQGEAENNLLSTVQQESVLVLSGDEVVEEQTEQGNECSVENLSAFEVRCDGTHHSQYFLFIMDIIFPLLVLLNSCYVLLSVHLLAVISGPHSLTALIITPVLSKNPFCLSSPLSYLP